jgi:hypothetical protein
MRSLIFVVFVASLTCASDAQCDLLTWQIEVDKPTYVLGETVQWTVSVNASSFSGSNFGLAGAQASLTESRGETLSAASFAATPINNYDLKSGGTGGAGFLNNFSAAEFAGNSGDLVETTDDTVFTLFATGTFSATVLGAMPQAKAKVTLPTHRVRPSLALSRLGFPFQSPICAKFPIRL